MLSVSPRLSSGDRKTGSPEGLPVSFRLVLIGLLGRLATAAGKAEPGQADAEQRERRRLRYRSRCQIAEDKDQIVVIPVASLRPRWIFPSDRS